MATEEELKARAVLGSILGLVLSDVSGEASVALGILRARAARGGVSGGALKDAFGAASDAAAGMTRRLSDAADALARSQREADGLRERARAAEAEVARLKEQISTASQPHGSPRNGAGWRVGSPLAPHRQRPEPAGDWPTWAQIRQQRDAAEASNYPAPWARGR
jgi:hypothetical protein